MALCGFWRWGEKNWEGIMLNQSRKWQLRMQGSRVFGFVNVALSPHFTDVEEKCWQGKCFCPSYVPLIMLVQALVWPQSFMQNFNSLFCIILYVVVLGWVISVIIFHMGMFNYIFNSLLPPYCLFPALNEYTVVVVCSLPHICNWTSTPWYSRRAAEETRVYFMWSLKIITTLKGSLLWIKFRGSTWKQTTAGSSL